MWNENWIKGEDYPAWGNNDVYKKTISGGYLYHGETPKEAYQRVAKTVARRLYKPEMAETFFEYIWNGWLCLASPVLSNTGTDRGLPISCFGIDVADSIQDIGQKNLEMMLLAKHGGGVGIGINQIRPAGAKITGNGTSDGVVPFCKIYDSTILATNQGSVRRGAASVNINIEHADFEDWIEIREPKGDVNRQSLNLHQCAVVGDKFMRRVEAGDKDARKRWSKLLQKRKATGEPYILFKGNTNKNNPAAYKENGLKVHMTNICSEITLHTDENHSFVCCLSSLNLAKYEEWKGTNLIYDSIWFLDGVMEEFIQRAKGLRGFENASAQLPKAERWALEYWAGIRTYKRKGSVSKVYLLSLKLGKYLVRLKLKVKELQWRWLKLMENLYGVLELVCVILIYALLLPLFANSKLSGNVSPGIEPWAANVFTEQTAKGTFIRKNPSLVKLLRKLKINNNETWDKILADGGSVQNITELNDVVMAHETPAKEVFKTFKEINQLELVNQAGLRQQYVDQSVSLNLAFPSVATPKWINKVHYEAWKKGVKTLYYTRTESVLRGDIAQQAMNEDCLACDG